MCSVSDRSATALAERLGYVEQRPQASAEAIEAPHDERTAGADGRERAIETRPRSQRARGRIPVNDGASGSAQRVELQRCGLLVRRHARIADQARRPRFDDRSRPTLSRRNRAILLRRGNVQRRKPDAP